MRRFLGDWAGSFIQQALLSVKERYVPAHPIASAFFFLGGLLFFFLALIAFILGTWILVSEYVTQIAAIWIMFGILAALMIVFLLIGYCYLRPKSTKTNFPASPFYNSSSYKEDSVEQIIVSFLNGFFSK